MRSLVAAAFGFSLAGCATVSVIPGETTVTSDATAEQSALRVSAELFCEKAEAEGWVSDRPGLLGLAAILMNGSDDDAEPAGTYADRIDAGSADITAVLVQIESDATAAREGLLDVTGEAERLLEDPAMKPDRLDAVAFERALVRAQRANRGFLEAFDIVSERTETTDATFATLDAFARTIDASRRTADRLDKRRTDTEAATATS